METIDWNAALDRLKRLSDSRPASRDDGEWRIQRQQRLAALEVDPDHVRLVLARRDCPTLAGHKGSIAAAEAAERFVTDLALRLLVLGGPTGRGKTVTATWIASVLDACRWISAKDVRVGDSWSQSQPRAAKAAVLVVDDLGHETSEWAHKELSALLESRFDKGYRTVVTTNMPPAVFAKTYGDRLASRLEHQTRGLYVVCGGDDLRRSK